jgi:hypothetical protein
MQQNKLEIVEILTDLHCDGTRVDHNQLRPSHILRSSFDSEGLKRSAMNTHRASCLRIDPSTCWFQNTAPAAGFETADDVTFVHQLIGHIQSKA